MRPRFKRSNKQTLKTVAALMLLATGLNTPSVGLSQTVNNLTSKDATVVAITFPNFTPKVEVSGDKVNLYLPSAMVEAVFNQVLKSNEGRFKDTSYNRQSIFDTRGSVNTNTVNVTGSWRVEHREKLFSALGKSHYTPWASVSGRFNQYFKVYVSENRLKVATYGQPMLTGNSRWYGDIVSMIAPLFAGNVQKRINNELSSINGLNIKDLLIANSSSALASKYGLERSEIEQVLQREVGNINAGIANSQVYISYTVPNKTLLALAEQKNTPTPNPPSLLSPSTPTSVASPAPAPAPSTSTVDNPPDKNTIDNTDDAQDDRGTGTEGDSESEDEKPSL